MKTETKADGLQAASTARTCKAYRTPSMEAERLHSSLRTIREKIRTREIPFYRFGHKILLVAEEVDAAIAQTRQRAHTEPKRHAGRIGQESAA